jgi:hypothetical protein
MCTAIGAKTLEIRVELTDAQAWDLAQFLERIGFADYRNNATSDDQAYAMRTAVEQVRRALAECGYAPR